MPKVVTAEPEKHHVEESAMSESALSTQTVRPARPIVRVKVAYLGGDPFRSVALPGKIMSEKIGEREVKSIADTGNTSYEFRLRDTAGDLIKERIVPDSHPIADIRGRVWTWVEHPDHAYALANYRNKETKRPEFQLFGDTPKMELLTEYFHRVNRAKRDKQREIVEVTG